MNLGALIATLGVDATGLKTAQTQMRTFETQLKSFGRSMNRYVTLPMAVAGGAALKMYSDFEASMTKITSLVGVGRDQVQAWNADVLQMAGPVAQAPGKLADALFFVTSAGVRGAEAMEVLEMSAKAATSGLGEVKTVADLVTSAMNAYGKENLNAQQATDVLVAAVREGKAEADALASSMGMVLPIASNMGVTFSQVGAAVAAMTRTGTNAQTASVQLRQILNSLIKPAQQSEEALMAMGTSAAALRRTIREEGLLTALMQIRELTNKYGEDTMAKVFPNIRALSGVLDIMGSNMQDNVAIFQSLENAQGSLNMAFEETQKTLKFKFNSTVTSVKTGLVTLGQSMAMEVIPILEGLADRVGRVIEWWNRLDEPTRRMIIRVGALAAAIGPLVTILGVLASAVRAMLSPMGLVMTAITLLGAGIATLIIRTHDLSEAQTALNSVQDMATKAITDQRTRMEQLLKIARDESQVLEDRRKAMEELNKMSPEYFGNLNLEYINTENARRATAAYTAELLRQAKVKAAQEKLVELQKRYIDEIEQGAAFELTTWQKLVSFIKAGMGGVAASADYATGAMIENFSGTREELEAAQKAIQALLDELVKVDDLVGSPTYLDPTATETFETALRSVDGTLNDFFTELDAIGKLQTALGPTYDSLAAYTTLYQQTIDNLIRAGLDPYDERIQTLANELLDLIAIQQEFSENTDDVTEALQQTSVGANLMKTAFAGMSNVISDSLNDTQGFLEAFGEFFKDFIRGLIIRLVSATIAAAALAVVLNAIPGMQVNLGKAFKEAKTFKDLFTAGFKSFAGMQHGGIVPPGFPGDTYPAMLTSGEAVVPPKDLRNLTSHTTITPRVIGIRGREIRILLEEEYEQHENTET